jgi:serine/threonine protein phosphatase PrpC
MTHTAPTPHREPLTVTFSAKTDVGRVRADNEDNFLIDRRLRLYVVCDGLGGHASGEVASAAAVNTVREGLARRRAALEAFEFDTGTVDEATILAVLKDVVAEANAHIHDRGKHIPAQRGMGTTLTLLLVIRDKGFIAHVGDSRLYRLRQGALRQLSEDHSLASELERGLTLADDKLRLDERAKNQITRALGVRDSVEVDLHVTALLAGDRYLLCSDGLHGLVPDGEIAAVMQDNDISLVADRLVDLANARGGTDNITAVAVEIEAPRISSAPRRIWPDFDALRASPAFRQMSDPDLATLLETTHPITLAPQDPLLSEARPVVVPGLFLVVDGDLAVRRSGELITSLRVGDTFGEESLFIERTNTVDLFAGTSGARLLLLERVRFEALATARPELVLPLTLAMAKTLARKVDASVREAGARVVYQPQSYASRPTPRPATSPRLLIDTEPEPNRAIAELHALPPELPTGSPAAGAAPADPRKLNIAQVGPSTAVLRRPRATDRRVFPSQTMPAPEPGAAEPEPDRFAERLAERAIGAPERPYRGFLGPRSAEIPRRVLMPSPPPLPPGVVTPSPRPPMDDPET